MMCSRVMCAHCTVIRIKLSFLFSTGGICVEQERVHWLSAPFIVYVYSGNEYSVCNDAHTFPPSNDANTEATATTTPAIA